MSHLDTYVKRELENKHPGSRKPRSESGYRLYWATFQRSVTRRAPAHESKNQVRKTLDQLFKSLQSWWGKRASSGVQASEGESRTHPQIPRQGNI